MEGIITIKDTRDNLDAMKNYRAEEAKKIANSLSTEGIIDTVADTAKTVVTVAGSVLTLATKFFPGKLDDIAVAVAQPAIINVIDAGRNLLKGIFVNKDKEQICASISDLSGNVKNITIKDANLVETINKKTVGKITNIRTVDNIQNERMVK